MRTNILRRGNTRRIAVMAAASIVGLEFASRANATVYTGNGATGFGGPVGQGTLSVTDATYTDPTTLATSPGVTIAFATSSGHPSGLDGNNLVIYVSTGAAGLSDTSSLIDTGLPAGSDNGHTAISGYNNFNNGGQVTPSRTEVAFPTGFQATYAFSYANAYDGLFKLPTDGSGNLAYLTGASPVNANNTLTIPLSLLGLSPGQSFSLIGTYLDGSSAYRSNEAFGDATVNGTATSLTAVGNPGFNNLLTFSDFSTFTTVPEPASVSMLAFGGLVCARRRSR